MKRMTIAVLMLSIFCCCLFAGCNEKIPDPTDAVAVTLNQSSIAMSVYERQTLIATVKNAAGETVDGEEITWSSSDPRVAEVADGVVTAKGEGSVVITAKLRNGATAECKVTAEVTGMVPQLVVTNVSGNKLSIANGQTFQLESAVSFAGKDSTDVDTAFSFAVEDSSVAAVSDEGLITGLKEGSTTVIITATWRGIGGENISDNEEAYGLRIVIDLTVINP